MFFLCLSSWSHASIIIFSSLRNGPHFLTTRAWINSLSGNHEYASLLEGLLPGALAIRRRTHALCSENGVLTSFAFPCMPVQDRPRRSLSHLSKRRLSFTLTTMRRRVIVEHGNDCYFPCTGSTPYHADPSWHDSSFVPYTEVWTRRSASSSRPSSRTFSTTLNAETQQGTFFVTLSVKPSAGLYQTTLALAMRYTLFQSLEYPYLAVLAVLILLCGSETEAIENQTVTSFDPSIIYGGTWKTNGSHGINHKNSKSGGAFANYTFQGM